MTVEPSFDVMISSTSETQSSPNKNEIQFLPKSERPHVKWILPQLHKEQSEDEEKVDPVKKPRVYELKIPIEYKKAFNISRSQLSLGGKKSKAPNGTTIYQKNHYTYVFYSNNDILIKFPTGVTGYKYASEEILEFSDSKGTFYVFNNNQIEYKSKEKSITQHPNGQYTIMYPNGDFEVHFKDGKFEKNIGGTVTNGYEYEE